ncbi:MAG: succinylglutamate desuccinylase/aspartoacylase family protein, partial [Gammaproteobacteria bacterium]|nr:succinylglutamate desuccinylase/aspartoacylase family protein [Gammaproteobacteria bacterium]
MVARTKTRQAKKKKAPPKNQPVTVGGISVAPGEDAIVDLPVADLYTHTQLTLPVHVINGKHPGPTLFLTAAIHGDELNGVDIIRRVLRHRDIKRLRGQLLAVPIVNVYGFVNRSRYLPDRRDLNRSFPGRKKGSVAARLAHLVTSEIISQADFGIDLHTGAIDRPNLPQIRANLDNPKVLEIAEAFETPVIIDANIVAGSLREYAEANGIPLVVYEAGEALRFDELSIKAGTRGVLRVMRMLGMLPPSDGKRTKIQSLISRGTSWTRAPASGIVHAKCRLGQRVSEGQSLASIADPFGQNQTEVEATAAG